MIILWLQKEERQEEHSTNRQEASTSLFSTDYTYALFHLNPTEIHVLDNPGVKDIRSELFILAMNMGN